MFSSDPFQRALDALSARPSQIKVSGLWGAAEALFLSHVARAGHPFCLVAASEPAAERMRQDLLLFFRLLGVEREILFFPPWDTLPYEPTPPRADWIARRLSTLYQLAQDDHLPVVTSIDAFLQKVVPKSDFIEGSLLLSIGGALAPSALLMQLDRLGYARVDGVTRPGEVAVRGGIVDVFSPTMAHPARLEFFGDAIESLRAFDPQTQRSTTPLATLEIIPGRECLDSTRLVPFCDYLSPETLLVIDEPDDVLQKGKRFCDRAEEGALFSTRHSEPHRDAREVDPPRPGVPPPEALYLPLSHLDAAGAGRTTVDLELLSLRNAPNVARLSFDTCSLPALGFCRPDQPFSQVAERLNLLRRDHVILLVVRQEPHIGRIERLLGDHDLPYAPWSGEDAASTFPAPVRLISGDLSEGFVLPQEKTLVLTEAAWTGKPARVRRPSPTAVGGLLTPSQEAAPGDPVVHMHHGIGRYVGLQSIPIRQQEWGKGVSADFYVIQYAGGDKVYVPMDSLHLVQRYVGPEGLAPALDRLGGTRWAKAKAQAARAISDMMAPLLKLYAERALVEGHAYLPEEAAMEEFAAAFEYEETPDQLRSIEETLADMRQGKPMDRLICGDVGFGKTEVAMRAAFCAVLDHKQVAVVAPTTLLAHQHHQTFTRRFAPFAARVDVISRFRTSGEQKKIVADARSGAIDVLIGTHRLLQKDVQFRDLGLVVIDEEHRFGVRHKEWLKEMRKQVDVLTLTATPIPRTLQMAISQTRDLSVIETAPADRLPIQTVLAPFDPRMIREAIFRELVRGGQVFFVHDRVHDIEALGNYLAALVPEARIGVAHGQMREQPLEEVILKFIEKEYTLLLTTTIIESGIDIPSANTILINNADRFGLAELYQLRGRVGRAGEQAYAYLLVKEERILTEESRRRLRAIQEFTELGSGFKVAARDLEIRGAGNLLGGEQSGQVAAVGFEMYLKMINEAVEEMRGKKPVAETEPSLQFQQPATLPEGYIPDAGQRLILYKRLSTCRTPQALSDLEAEMRDRFGALPDEAARLIQVMQIRQKAKAARVLKIVEKARTVSFVFDAASGLVAGDPLNMVGRYGKRIHFTSGFSFDLDLATSAWEECYLETCRCLDALLAAGGATALVGANGPPASSVARGDGPRRRP